MKNKLLLLFSWALVLRLLIAPLVWHPDLNNHIDWGIRFFEYGARLFYSPDSNVWSFTWPNQPPGTILIFAFIRKLYEFVFGILWFINVKIPQFPSSIIVLAEKSLYPTMLKLPAIFADLGIAYLIYRFVGKISPKMKLAFIAAVVFLFNPVIWYNSTVWGQTDAVINFLFLLSFYFLINKRLFWAIIFLALCLYVKVSLAILLPIYFVVLLKQKFSIRKKGLSFLVSLLLILVLTLLFSYPKEPISWLIEIYSKNILTNQLQIITANSFNLWALIAGIAEKPHSLMLGPIKYQLWGQLLFLVALLPIIYKLWKNYSIKNAVWAFFLTAFASWLLLTNMHERYLYPAFGFFTIILAINLRLLPIYIMVSAINVLNLYNFWWVPSLPFVKEIISFSNYLMARVLGFVNVMLFIVLYKKNIINSWGEQK